MITFSLLRVLPTSRGQHIAVNLFLVMSLPLSQRHCHALPWVGMSPSVRQHDNISDIFRPCKAYFTWLPLYMFICFFFVSTISFCTCYFINPPVFKNVLWVFKDKLIFISKANNKCTNIVISPGKKEIKRRLKTISVNSQENDNNP